MQRLTQPRAAVNSSDPEPLSVATAMFKHSARTHRLSSLGVARVVAKCAVRPPARDAGTIEGRDACRASLLDREGSSSVARVRDSRRLKTPNRPRSLEASRTVELPVPSIRLDLAVLPRENHGGTLTSAWPIRSCCTTMSARVLTDRARKRDAGTLEECERIAFEGKSVSRSSRSRPHRR